MPSSPIRKLVPFADKAKERGIKVYHLNIGQPDIQTPDVALQALKTCNEKVIEYTHSAGNISYRKKLAKYYQNIGINIDENNTVRSAVPRLRPAGRCCACRMRSWPMPAHCWPPTIC